MITAKELSDAGNTGAKLIDPPAGAVDRLTKALAKAVAEGRGKKTIDDITVTFFTAMSGFLSNMVEREYAYIENNSSPKSFVSDYDAWTPKGVDEAAIALYDCYVVANEINAL